MRDRLFFELAAGLIPALLLGGILASVKPGQGFAQRSLRSRRWSAAGVAAGVAFFLVAEVFAIELALGGEFSFLKVSFVAYAIVGATLLLGAALLWPWLRAADMPLSAAWIGPPLALVIVVGGGFLIGPINRAEEAAYNRCIEERVAPLYLEWATLSDELFELMEEAEALAAEEGLSSRERAKRVEDIASRSRSNLPRSEFMNALLGEALRYCLE